MPRPLRPIQQFARHTNARINDADDRLSGGVASFSTTTLAAGTHVITAVYSGDGTFTGSQDSLSSAVTTATPAVAVSDAGGVYNGGAFLATAAAA